MATFIVAQGFPTIKDEEDAGPVRPAVRAFGNGEAVIDNPPALPYFISGRLSL
jgi:hypothetical protein